MEFKLQVLMAAVTILGSGFSAYMGMRVAITEMRKDIQYLREKNTDLRVMLEQHMNDMKARILRLEEMVFMNARDRHIQ